MKKSQDDLNVDLGESSEVKKMPMAWRMSPHTREQISDLIKRGKYSGFSDFINKAVEEKLNHDLYEDRIAEMVSKEMRSEEMEKILKKQVQVALQDLISKK